MTNIAPIELITLILCAVLLAFLAGWQAGKAATIKRFQLWITAKESSLFVPLPGWVQTRAPKTNQRN